MTAVGHSRRLRGFCHESAPLNCRRDVAAHRERARSLLERSHAHKVNGAVDRSELNEPGSELWR
jgi:hypothetical protein